MFQKRFWRFRQKAFTLLEVIITILIVSILTSIALPKMLKLIESSRATEALISISAIQRAMDRAFLMGSFTGDLISFNKIDLEDPGLAPGAHFSYQISLCANNRPTYAILATRKNTDNAGIYANQRIYLGVGGQISLLSNGTSQACNDDNKFYWDADDIYKARIPK